MAKLSVKVERYERQVGNWLKAYLEYTKESESPDNYHIWTALSSIASVVKRHVWIDQQLYILYPNMYVALVGPPARTAKTTAIRMGRRLIQTVPGVMLGPDACSREQLIRRLAESKFDNQCALTLHSGEFSSLIDVSGILMIQFLTDIYDCDYSNPAGWKYETKHEGKDKIVNPFINMLVGTTPSYLAESMPPNVVSHGFTSRTIFIYEEIERLINPRPGTEDLELAKALAEDLTHISSLYGQFVWSKGADDAYDSFYRGLYKNVPSDNRIEGYHWRKKIHVLKIAMLLSIAERDTLTLEAVDIETAAELLTAIEPNMARVFSAVGKYEHATDIERIGVQINKNGGMSMQEVYQKFYHLGSNDEIRQVLATLSMMGAIRLVAKNGQEWAIPGDSPMFNIA